MPTTTYSNAFFVASAKGEIDFDTDVIKVAMMASAFSFDRDAHDNYADVSASEIAAGNGYTAGGQALDNVVIAVDDPNDQATITYDDEVIAASGGDFPASAGNLYYDDTHGSKVIICYVAHDSDETVTDGNSMTISANVFRVLQGA